MHSKVWMFSHLIDDEDLAFLQRELDRKSTRLNSSH